MIEVSTYSVFLRIAPQSPMNTTQSKSQVVTLAIVTSFVSAYLLSFPTPGFSQKPEPSVSPAAPPSPAVSPVPPGSTAAPVPPSPPVSVTTVRAQMRDLPVLLQTTGTVTPVSSVDIRAQLTSVVTKVHIKEGQFVKKGESLFTLDARADEANVARARAQLTKDEAGLADAQRQLTRNRQLLSQNFISQGAVDTVQALVESAAAVVAADKAALDAARVPVSYARIVAPSAGRIGIISVFAGSVVQANLTPMVTITQLDPIAVAFNLPQKYLGDVLGLLKQGDGQVLAALPDSGPSNASRPVGPRVDAKPTDAKMPDARPIDARPTDARSPDSKPPNAKPADTKPTEAKPAEAKPAEDKVAEAKAAAKPAGPRGQTGKLSFVDTTIDANSGTVKAKAIFDNRSSALWPGAFVNVSVQIESLKDAVVIPQAAIVQTVRGSIVYVIDKENKASIRPVKILQGQGEEAAVSGLRPGEKIALEGRQNLRPGSMTIERNREGGGGPRGGPNGGSNGSPNSGPSGDKPAGASPEKAKS